MALDLLTVVNRFILACIQPGIPQERLYRGYQNRMAVLTDDGEDYCVYSISNTVRVGTNVTMFSASSIGTESLREYVVDVDFASTEEQVSLNRAECLETLAHSFFGVEHFRAQGYGLLFADDIKPLPYVNDADQYVYRYRVPLHVTSWRSAWMEQDYFERAEIGPNHNGGANPSPLSPFFENVDVHHLKKE